MSEQLQLECPHFEHMLVLPHMAIHNFNAINSSHTCGISITAFIGAMHALERKARAAGWDWQFRCIGIVVHDHSLQAISSQFTSALLLTRNPIKGYLREDKKIASSEPNSETGAKEKFAPIIEEGRIHLTVTLTFGIYSESMSGAGDADKASQVRQWLAGMRLGGGSVWQSPTVHPKRQQPWWLSLGDTAADRAQAFARAKLKLLPGFTLVDRSDLLPTRLQQMQKTQPQATTLDAWLSLCRTNWEWSEAQGKWLSDRPKGSGWIVPIPTGYAALTHLLAAGSVANARDTTTPFRFVESVYSVGEWLGPHRLTHPQDMMWWPQYQHATGLYRCCNGYQPPAPALESESAETSALAKAHENTPPTAPDPAEA